MTEELSPADRSSLAAERGPINMAVGGLLVFDGKPRLTRAMIAERIGERIHLIPRLRQRLAEPPLGLANPVWADDHGFDLDWHVRQAGLPVAGADADAELGWFVGRGGLEREWRPQRYDLRRHVTHLASRPLTAGPRLMLDGMLRALDPDPRRAAGDMRRATGVALELARTRPQAPMTPLNRGISPNRRYAVAHAPLPAFKSAGRAYGGTVNDAVLAVVAGTLGRYLQLAPESSGDRSPVALVPVSVRSPDEDGGLGNRISTVFVDLPVDEPQLGDRVAAVAAQTRELKDSAAVRAGALMVGAAGWAPPLVSGLLARALGSVRAFNLVVSNIPGPQQPFFLGGVRMQEVYPVVPLNPANQGLTIGVLSYDGQVCFGLLGDRDLDPPLAEVTAALRDELVAL